MSANNHFSSTINNLPDDPAPPENVTANATHVSGKKEKYRTTSAQAGEPIHPSGSSFHDQITRHKVVLPPQPLSQLVELNCATAAIISSINGQIKEADLLLADGSNYTVWSDFIDKQLSTTKSEPSRNSPERTNTIVKNLSTAHGIPNKIMSARSVQPTAPSPFSTKRPGVSESHHQDTKLLDSQLKMIEQIERRATEREDCANKRAEAAERQAQELEALLLRKTP
ncbi:hypothetical protein PCANC_20020, partial [Puccinia coronata f. sp. avenae]